MVRGHKILPRRLIFPVALAGSLAPSRRLKQAEQFLRTTLHDVLKVWPSLEKIGSPPATGKDVSQHRWSNYGDAKYHACKP